MTHYDTLGVPRDATDEQITEAYRRLSLKYHPDRKEGDPAKMAQINAAYEVLSDPEARREYDGDDEVMRNVKQILRGAIGAMAQGEKIGNIVRESQQQLDTAIQQIQGHIRDSQRQLSRLEASRARIDADVWRTLVEEEIADVNNHIEAGIARVVLLQNVRLELAKFTDTASNLGLVFPTPPGIPR